MTRMIARSCAVSLIILALAGLPCAQALSGDSVNQKPSVAAGQDARIESLLVQLADQARSLDDLAFAVNAQMQAASLLYFRDRERARAIYRRAFDSIAPVQLSKSNENAQRVTAPRVVTPAERQQLRGELLNEIANRDPELAEEMTRALADSIGAAGGCAGVSMAECDQTAQAKFSINGQSTIDVEQRELLVSVALQIVEHSPQRAMALGQLSMAAGISPNFTRLLILMRGADAGLADLLFAGAVSRLEPFAVVSLNDIHVLGSYLVAFANSSDRNAIDRSVVTRFLNLAFKQIAHQSERMAIAATNIERMAGDESDTLYFLSRQLTDLFRRYQPNRLEDLQRCIGELSDRVATSMMLEASEANSDAFKEGVAEVKATDDERERDRLNAQAAIAWLAKGDTADALKSALKISVAETRDRVLAQVARRQLAAGAVEDAVWVARRIDNLSSRVDAMVVLAAALLASKDKTRAFELLNESESYLAKARPTTERARSLLKVAGAFSSFDSSRSFEVMQAAIKSMNDALRLQQSKQETALAIADARPATAVEEVFDSNLERALAALARVDFDRALALAEQLADKEASIMAQLAVCRGGLAKDVQAEQRTSAEEEEFVINHF
jgi:hypothetical protein